MGGGEWGVGALFDNARFRLQNPDLEMRQVNIKIQKPVTECEMISTKTNLKYKK